MKVLCAYVQVEYNDAKCYGSPIGQIMVWDFKQGAQALHVECDVNFICTTKIGKCVPIIKMQIELNMVEECVMDFGFAKDNPRNSSTPTWLI